MFGRKKRSGPAARFEDEAYDEYTEYDEYAEEEEAEYDEDFDGFDDAPTDERVYDLDVYAAARSDDDPSDESTVDEGAGRGGPYDYDDVADLLEAVADQRLDLGSVIMPVPPGGQLQVEMTPDGAPQAVHLATEYGRITVAAYAAPKSVGQWRTVVADLADSLRKDGSRVSVETGPWGRELLAVTDGADLRFIGVDGYRWMVRLIAAGPSGAAAEGSPLVNAARAILRETVIRRGTDPLPVGDPLPVVLPQELVEQLAAAHQAQVEAQQQALAARATVQAHPPTVLPPRVANEPRRGIDGSAMQQLGLN